MKQCPTCKGIFDDDTLRYCLSDGSLLTSPYDSEATHIFSPTLPTKLPPVSVLPDRPAPLQPPRQGVSPVVVYVLIAVLALVVGGGLMVLLRPDAANHTPSPTSTLTPKQESAQTVNDELEPRKQTTPEARNLSTPTPTPVVLSQQSATPQPPIVVYNYGSDLTDKSCFELKVMRNEIFARHGYIFKTEDMRNYFSRQSWYRPLYADVSSLLSTTENRSVQLIKQYERRKGCQ